MTKLTSNIAQGRIYHAALIAGPHGGLVVERKGRRGGAVQRHIDDRRTELAREQLRLDWLQSDLDAAT